MTANSKYYDLPIVDFLEMIGEPIISNGHSGKYYQHKDHDSLKINREKNYFFWNSRGATGGVVQYLMAMYDLTKEEAHTRIAQELGEKELKPATIIKKPLPKKFSYRAKENYLSLEAQRYLVSVRKIPNKIVREFLKEDLIAENNKHEILFKWWKDDKIIGFSKQGTVCLTEEEKRTYNWDRDYVKYVAPTTEEGTYWGFNRLVGSPKHLYYFESSIDLMSYYTLYYDELHQTGDFWLISLEGLTLKKVVLFFVHAKEILSETSEEIKKIVCCFDNDEAGREAFKKLDLHHYRISEEKAVAIENQLPPQLDEKNDWNNQLILTKKERNG